MPGGALDHNRTMAGPTDTAYPLPTAATVRQLYGSAFRCAHPQCQRPLYKLNDDTGDRVLNSRVAHIHARRQGGPRWIEMPPEENRAGTNLVLLCIEHSYEVDETPDVFPAEMLREWKAAQIAEYDDIQRNWPIDDEEATEVLVASETFEILHAPATVELVRRVEALRLVAERTRSGPRSWSRRWQQLIEQTNRSFTAWDDDGNPVYLEPSDFQVSPLQLGIQEALAAALDEVRPSSEAARIELAAVLATRPQMAPWCEALDRAITRVVEEASTWTARAAPDEDGVFDTSLADLQLAVKELVRASRGEQVDVPEPPTAVSAEDSADPFTEHRKLLEEARPFVRVGHRQYDPALRERVAQAIGYAATIPPTPHLLPYGLDSTAHLAVAVAGNASEDDQLELVERDRRRLPICAATALLAATIRTDDSDEQRAHANAAREELQRLWSDTDWSSEASWADNDINGQSMMYTFAAVTSPEEVRERLANVLYTNPDLLEPLVLSCAGWVEQVDRQTFRPLRFDRVYSQIPPWLPIDAIRTAAAGVLKDDSEFDAEQILAALLQKFDHAG